MHSGKICIEIQCVILKTFKLSHFERRVNMTKAYILRHSLTLMSRLLFFFKLYNKFCTLQSRVIGI